MRKLLATLAWIIVILGGAAAGAYYFLGGEQAKGVEKYRAEKVDRGDVTMSVTATGTISAVTTVQVGSQVSGIIARLYADFNSPVKKGQLLAELDPTPFEATVAQNRATLEQAEVQARNSDNQFRRMERLLKANLVPESDYETAMADRDGAAARVQQAQAALDQAETNLRYTKILSPIGGVVVDRQYDVGQTVAAAFQAPTLFTIAQDLTRMQVQTDVDQSDIGRVRVGQKARFTVDAYPDEDFEGKITQLRLNATVNQNVVTYPVIIEVPNPESKLRPKMTADVRIEVAKVTNVLRVANAALRFRPTEGGGGKGAGGGGKKKGGDGKRAGGDDAGSAGGTGKTTGGKGGAGDGQSAMAADGNRPSGDGERSESGGGPGKAGEGPDGAGAEKSAASDAPAGTDRDPDAGAASARESGDARSDGPPSAGGSGLHMWGSKALDSAMRQVAGGVGGGAGRAGRQTIYILESKNTIKPVEIRTGISDGKYTEIVSGSIEPGQKVVVGLVTARAEQTAGAPRVGGRMF